MTPKRWWLGPSNYVAWVKLSDGHTSYWRNLRKTQAKWRYQWLERNLPHNAVEYGWKVEEGETA